MRPWILLIALGACTGDVADRADRAARRVTKEAKHLRHQRGETTRQAAAFAHAKLDFEELRALRVKSLRAEHSVSAVQPIVIMVLANATEMAPVRRARLDENLAFFRRRLTSTRELIEKLEQVPAGEWESRDDEVAREMASMVVARDASWHVLEGKRDEIYPDT